MSIEVFEGTFAELQKEMGRLSIAPEKRVRVLVEESLARQRTFEDVVIINGVPTLPRRPGDPVITQELIDRIREEEGI